MSTGRLSRMDRRRSSDIKLNPLLMEPILERVLQQLSLEDLNNCVSVCKLWSKEAIRVYKMRQTIELSSQQDLLDLWRKMRRNSGPVLIVNKLDTKNLNLEDPIFERFMRAIASKLSMLILHDTRSTLEKLHKLLRMVPDLVRLEIGTVKMVYGNYSHYHQLFPIYETEVSTTQMVFHKLKHLEFMSYNEPGTITQLSAAFRTFPNLKTLAVSNLSAQHSSNFDGIQMPQLEELTITNFQGREYEINEKHFKMLMHVRFDSLKQLKLMNVKKTIDAGIFRQFVERHRETLKLLEIRHYCSADETPSQGSIRSQMRRMSMFAAQGSFVNIFPLDLPNLEKLRVERSHVVSVPRIFSSLPKLKKLYLNFKSDSNWMAILPKNFPPFPQLKELFLSWIDPKSLRILANAFTGVTLLNICECDDDILHVIYENMPQLEFLICTDSKDRKMTSEGFTGIPCSRFSKLVVPNSDDDSDSDNWVDVDFAEDFRHFRNKSYIGQLENLKHVTLFFSNYASGVNIFEYGLEEVPSLKTVIIDGLELEVDLRMFLENTRYPVLEFKYLPPPLHMNNNRYTVYFCDIQEGLSDLRTYMDADIDAWCGSPG